MLLLFSPTPVETFPLETEFRPIYEAHSEIDPDDLDVICKNSIVKLFYSLRIADYSEKVLKSSLGFGQASDSSQDNI